MDNLFSIGKISKLFKISVSSLRHYEDLGLLTPEYISRDSGYRYYSTAQFEVLNTIRYLRALDMPLNEITDFLKNRNIENIEQKLKSQKEQIAEKQAELDRIAKKIDNRLKSIQSAKNSHIDEIVLTELPPCRAIRMESHLEIKNFLDMETPIRRLEQDQPEALVFLGKVGIGICAENLKRHKFTEYDNIFLLLDNEDKYAGNAELLKETCCVQTRFRGSHDSACKSYEKLLDFIEKNGLTVNAPSREITLIDYGLTSDTEKFVTEISIPIQNPD